MRKSLERPIVGWVISLSVLAFAAAHAADAPPPIVKEGRTVKISPHVYVITGEPAVSVIYKELP